MSVQVQASEVLKSDQFGRVERVRLGTECFVRRVACGSKIPLSAWIARRLLARERRALELAQGLAGVPPSCPERSNAQEGWRRHIEGCPLSKAESLPEDFFVQLEARVLALHARGICHNDLHKEQNILVAPDGWPWLLDFQLASIHPQRGAIFASRAREDLRHIEKHRRRYTRHGRGPGGLQQRGQGAQLRRSWIAWAWRRLGKPIYQAITRGLLRTRDGEERRSESGPWPRWTKALVEQPSPQSTSSR